MLQHTFIEDYFCITCM